MKKYTYILLIFSISSYASVYDYIYPYNQYNSYSNYGTIGLVQNPTARFQDAGTLAFSWSHREPYLNGSIIAYPFEWLEASYQYTDINNAFYSRSKRFSGGQSYKDKGFDFKFRILKSLRCYHGCRWLERCCWFFKICFRVYSFIKILQEY